MQFSFTVGTGEQHVVEFTRDWISGAVHVTVDGAEALSTVDPPIWFKLTKRYEFTVGDREPHAVVIENERPLLVGGSRPHTYRVLIDGQLTATHKGR